MAINPDLIIPSLKTKLRHSYKKSTSDTCDNYELISNPFKVLKLNNVLDSKSFLEKLIDSVEKVPLFRKNNDLYSLWQSDDLKKVDDPVLQKFIQFLKTVVGPYLSDICNIKFKEEINVTASLYCKGDMLLCHDDKCDDRCVAFAFYLTGRGSENGGAFRMFDRDTNGQPTEVVKSIPAEANSLVIFEVGDYTYHEVSEIKDDFRRLSIHGWFLSDRKLNELKYIEPFPRTHDQLMFEGCKFLDDYINIKYCTPSIMKEIQSTFENESHTMLSNFFNPNIYTECENTLNRPSICWVTIGPPNRRRYEVTNINNTFGPLQKLVEFLRSPVFVAYLSNISGLAFEPLVDLREPSTKIVLEIQRWTSGSYTMATDNDEFFSKPGLDVYLFFNSKGFADSDVKGGFITYLATDEDDDESSNELLNIEPVENALVMVYRTSHTVRFLKYIRFDIENCLHCISVTYYEPD